MKKLLIMLLAAVCILIPTALAEEEAPYDLQEHMVMDGMDKSWYQGYEPIVDGDKLYIHLPLKSERSNGKVTVTLVLDDPEISPIKSEKLTAVFWRSEGLFSAKLSLKLSPSRINGDYSGKVVLEGDDKDGRDMKMEIPVIIRIRNGKAETGVHPAIENVSGTLNVGEEGKIAARITNTSRYSEMTDVLLTVTDRSGDILPTGSDILKIRDLAPGEAFQIEYPVLVKPNAGVALHEMEFHLTYAAAGAAGEWTETFTLPVTQSIRIEQGGIQMAQSVVQGDMATLTLPLMNMGRGELNNVMATLTMPGITDKQSVLVGSIGPGETKQAKISFTPGKNVLGEVAGEVLVTCEDAWGNATSFKLPTSITVEEPAPVVQQAVSIAEEAQENNPYILYILAGVSAALVIALILQGAILRRKIHRLEEERL